MSVSSPHPVYAANSERWAKYRDALAGEEAVKAKTDAYLPRLGGQSSASAEGQVSYKAYLNRAVFYNATRRTVVGLAGLATRKPAEFEGPDNLKALFPKLCDGKTSLDVAVGTILQRTLTVARVGVLADAPAGGGDPYLTVYEAEDIINWREETIDGETKLTLVVLREWRYEPRDGDRFELEKVEQYRVLYLDEGKYWTEVWRKAKDAKTSDGYVLFEAPMQPTGLGGNALEQIPFVIITPDGTTTKSVDSPLADLISLNYAHYRNSADLEHGLHFTALPTAWVAGFDPSTKLIIGSQNAWVTQNEQAKAGFLEFSGKGLGAIESAMTKKEKQMAVLGSRLLEEQPVTEETATAVGLRHSGQASVLEQTVDAVAAGVSKALGFVTRWLTAGGQDVRYKMVVDIDTRTLDPKMLEMLFVLLQAGRISYESFYAKLEAGDIVPEGSTPEEELERIEGEMLPPAVVEPEGTGSEGPSQAEDES